MQAQNINFPDAFFKEALLSSSSSNDIAKNLSGNYFAIDADGDGEISITEAENVSEIFFGMEDEYSPFPPYFNSIEGILNFTNLRNLTIFLQEVTLIDLQGLSNLEKVSISNSSDSGTYSDFSSSYNFNGCSALKNINISGQRIDEIKLDNVYNIEGFSLNSNIIYTYNFNNGGYLSKTPLPVIDFSQFSQLKSLSIQHFSIPYALDLSNLQNLQNVSLQSSDCLLLNVSNDNNLETLNIGGQYYNNGTFDFDTRASISTIAHNVPKLKTIYFGNGEYEFEKYGSDIILDVKNAPMLETIDAQFINLTIDNCMNVNVIKAKNFTGFDVKNCFALKSISGHMSIDELDFTNTNNPNIETIDVRGYGPRYNVLNEVIAYYKGGLKTVNVQALEKLSTLDCSDNQIESLFLKNGITDIVSIDKNPIQELDLPLSKIATFTASSTDLKYIKVLGIRGLTLNNITSENFKLITLDSNYYSNGGGIQITNNSILKELDLSESFLPLDSVTDNPLLEKINTKNGIKDYVDNSGFVTPFENNNSLKYICVDDSELIDAKNVLNDYGYNNVNINSYCSFTPGGSYNTISGTVKVDANNNGCDASDNPFEFLKLKINDGTTSGETFVQQNGKYEFYAQAGNFNITALAENPSLFNISPANFSTTFADSNNNVFTQDICVTANGTQNDAEVVIAPLTAARPGFDATYKLVWKNKGNTILSGKVVLNYDHNRMAFQNSSLAYSAISNGSIEFNYSDLKPFANGSTELVFTINTPTDPVNPVNSDDILPFNAQITPNMSDLTPEDNNFKFNQKVVNSFDPNDIVCMEGEVIPTVAVGKYMHYVVNFENTGTAEAENIVVKMNIDPAEFDINTLQLQNASADVSTAIAGNAVEFKFKKIKLKAGGHGHVLLKMRSLTGLQEGDTVNNKADIYFDYNFPVTTNDYVTTILDEHSVLNAKVNYEAAAFSSNNYTIDFDASLSTGNIASYAWEFPNAASVSSTSAIKPVVTYNVAGNYTAKLTVSDADNNTSVKTVSFKVGNTTADLSTGRDNDGNFIAVDADDDDWKGYDINGTEITPKVRTTYTGWGNADIGNGSNSRWVSLNNFEGYYNYKSRAFTIPNNATDAKLNLRSLSFVRNWTYLVKINPDGSETETEITKTQWLSDGFKGWLNSRSPKVDNYALSPGTYYIKVLVYSNNSTVRESLDVNAIVTSSTGLMNANKLVPPTITLQTQDMAKQKLRIYPVPTHGELNIDSDSEILSVEVHDAVGRILEKKHFAPSKSVKLTVNGGKGLYFLRIMMKQGAVNQKIIKE